MSPDWSQYKSKWQTPSVPQGQEGINEQIDIQATAQVPPNLAGATASQPTFINRNAEEQVGVQGAMFQNDYVGGRPSSLAVDRALLQDWQQYKSTDQQPVQGSESIPETFLRAQARNTSRVGEFIGSGFGLADLKDFVSNVLVSGSEYLAGEELPGLRSTLNSPLFGIRGNTTRELRDLSERLTGGYTAPQNQAEQVADDVLQDTLSLMVPIKGKVPNAFRSLGIAVGANAAKEGVKVLGGSDNQQTAAKLATMFTLSLVKPNSARNYAIDLYKKADSLLPSGTRTSATGMQNELNEFRQFLEKGLGEKLPEKSQMMGIIDKLLSKVDNGTIPVEDLISARIDINSIMKDPAALRGVKKLFPRLVKSVDGAINGYGAVDPEFLNVYRSANQAWGVLEQSRAASRFISDTLKLTPTKTAVGLAFEGALWPAGVVPTATGAAGAYGAVKGSELLYRIMKSPVLRHHYSELMKQAIKENTAGVVVNLKKLDNALYNDMQKSNKTDQADLRATGNNRRLMAPTQ